MNDRSRRSPNDEDLTQAAIAYGQAWMEAEDRQDMYEGWWECRLRGTPEQIASQRIFLETRGFKIYDEKKFAHLFSHYSLERALKLMWPERLAGWAEYKYWLLRFKVCTEAEFEDAISAGKSQPQK